MYGLPTTFSCSFLDCVTGKVGRPPSAWTCRLSQMPAFEWITMMTSTGFRIMPDFQDHMQDQAGTFGQRNVLAGACVSQEGGLPAWHC